MQTEECLEHSTLFDCIDYATEKFEKFDIRFYSNLYHAKNEISYVSHMLPSYHRLPSMDYTSDIYAISFFNSENFDIDTEYESYLKYNQLPRVLIFGSILVGDKLHVLCYMSVFKQLMVDSRILNTIFNYFGQEKFIEFIGKIETFFEKNIKMYEDGCDLDIQKDVNSIILSKSLMCIGNHIQPIIKSVDSWMRHIYGGVDYDNRSGNLLKYSVINNRNSVYRDYCVSLFDNIKSRDSLIFSRGMLLGCRFFPILVANGFVPNDENNSLEKDVNIYPTTCYFDGCLYDMSGSDEDMSYNITKFIIYPDRLINENSFELFAEGLHPNVAENKHVCIGDDLTEKWRQICNADTRKGDFNKLMDEFAGFISNIEDVMEVVNFSSSYFGPSYSDGFIKIEDNFDKVEKINRTQKQTWRSLD